MKTKKTNLIKPTDKHFKCRIKLKVKKIKSVKILLNNKKNLHLVKAAKRFTEKSLGISNCPTETVFFIKKAKIDEINKNFDNKKFKIIIGAGSSGPSTKWVTKNFYKLINRLNDSGNYHFFILCGPDDKALSDEIINNVNKNNCLPMYDKKIEEVIPYLCSANMYVGNDSFGSHIASQSGIKSLVILLDSPKAYTDYSKNYQRIIPDGIKIEDLNHGSNLKPEDISVEKVYQKIVNNRF